MFTKYNPKEDRLIICHRCGAVLDQDVVTVHTRNADDSKISYIECPICEHQSDDIG